MTIKIKKEYLEVQKNWNHISDKYGLTLTDQRIISKIKKIKGVK